MSGLRCQRDVFALPEGQHYLNCAYMSPMAHPVEVEGIAGIRAKRNPVSITAEDFFRVPDLVRRRFSELIQAESPDDVALIPAASYGIAVAARNAPVHAGQNIVAVTEQFPSNVYAWMRLADERGATLRLVEPGPAGGAGAGASTAGRWNQAVLSSIDDETAVVALPHVHWTDGTLFDLESIRTACDEVGALMVVDGTQSVGALPFDVRRIKPDALVCAGYKWLLGPYGFGVAYFGKRLLGGTPLEENWIARAGSENFGGLVRYVRDYQPGAIRYDVGERSNFVLAPMMLAALDLVAAWTPDVIQRYCANLAEPTLERLAEHGFVIAPPADRGSHLFGIRLPAEIEREAVATELARRNVAISIRGDALRVSPHVYNDPADIAALEEALMSVRVGSSLGAG